MYLTNDVACEAASCGSCSSWRMFPAAAAAAVSLGVVDVDVDVAAAVAAAAAAGED